MSTVKDERVLLLNKLGLVCLCVGLIMLLLEARPFSGVRRSAAADPAPSPAQASPAPPALPAAIKAGKPTVGSTSAAASETTAPGSAARAQDLRALRGLVESRWLAEDMLAAYGPLVATLKLSESDADALVQLIALQRQNVGDALAAARAVGVQKSAELKSILDAALKESDDKLKALLGDDGFERFKYYRDTLLQQNTVNRLEAALPADEPRLTPRQRAQLVQTMRDLLPPEARTTDFMLALNGSGSAYVSYEMVMAASGFLTTAQSAEFRRLFEDFKTKAQLGLDIAKYRSTRK